jgi:hypothetical protein
MGPVQRFVRRALIKANGTAVSTQELRNSPHARGKIWRALQRYAVRDRWGYWRPNDQLMRLIRGDEDCASFTNRAILASLEINGKNGPEIGAAN